MLRARRSAIAASPSPNACSTSLVCWPSAGGALRSTGGVADRRSGLATPVICATPSGPAAPSLQRGRLTARPRALTCGSSKACAIVLIGPHGTALSSSSVIHSAVVRVRVTASMAGISSARFCTRSVLVAKRGSLAHWGWPAAAQKRWN